MTRPYCLWASSRKKCHVATCFILLILAVVLHLMQPNFAIFPNVVFLDGIFNRTCSEEGIHIYNYSAHFVHGRELNTSNQFPKSNITFVIKTSCNTHEEDLNVTSCPDCVKTIQYLLKPPIVDLSLDAEAVRNAHEYFNVKPNIEQHLISRFLIQPVIECPYLLAVQASMLDRRHERDTVRSTWGSVAKQQTWPHRKVNAKVKVIFVVARDAHDEGDRRVPADLEVEAKLNNDILYIDMIESYQNLTLKVLSTFSWVKDNCPCVKFVLKIDFDTFVNVPLLVDTLIYFEDRFKFSFLGRVEEGPDVRREGKWAVDGATYPMPLYPNYASGCGYVLSYTALSRIVEVVPHVKLFPVEDVFITGVLRRVIGCQLFHTKKFLTHYSNYTPDICKLFEGQRVLEMSVKGIMHMQIWETFVKGACGKDSSVS